MAPRRVSNINSNGGGSSTMTVEMSTDVKRVAPWVSEQSDSSAKALSTPLQEVDDFATLPSPTTANTTPQLQRWNHPRINLWRVLGTFWSFVVLGANDAAYGALIPYLVVFYRVDYLTISLIFLSPIVGYGASALSNNLIHNKFGQRGVAAIMSVSHLVAYVVIALHPPYPVLVVIFMVAGFGNGLGDAGWNAWIGDMANANEVLGFLHAMYGLGALLSPLIATALITRAGWAWYEFYYFMIGAAAIEIVVLTATFWQATGEVYRAHAATLVQQRHGGEDSGTLTPVDEGESRGVPGSTWIQRANPFHDAFIMNTPVRSSKKSRSPSKAPSLVQKFNPFRKMPSTTLEAVSNRVTVLSSVFLLFYVGAEVSIGGWIVTFMLRVRGGDPFESGLVSTGFWLGLTVGRMCLGFATARLFPTEKHAVAFYLVACIILQLLFWLIPSFTVSAIMVGLLGFFIAPMFPAAIVAMTKLLPKRLHVAAVGFAAAVGASGATVLPFLVGAIAQSKGVAVLQPIILALLVVVTIMWLMIPKLPKQRMA